MPLPDPDSRRPRGAVLGLAAGLGLALLVVAAGAAPARAAEGDPPRRFTVDDIVDYFDTIVFGSELDPKFANTVVAKWEKNTITVSLENRTTPQYLEFVKKHIAELEKYTRLKFSGTKDPANADIRIFFLRTNEMGAITGPNVDPEAVRKAAQPNTNCYFLTWKKPESRIIKAIIAADVTKDAQVLNSCLLEELTQSLGLPNDSDLLRPSIFSDHDRLFELAPQDKLLVHLLYDPRMKAGLTREEALKTARAILTDLARSKSAK